MNSSYNLTLILTFLSSLTHDIETVFYVIVIIIQLYNL